MDLALELLAVVVLIGANAFFVISEYALVTARRSALEQRAQQGSRGARTALRLLDDPTGFISTVQICITALGILLGAVGERTLREQFDVVLPGWAAFALGFLLVTYFSVAFGELVPKALALHRPEPVASLVARPIAMLGRLFAPAVWLLQITARLVLRPLGVPAAGIGDAPVTRDELRALARDAEEGGALNAAEEDIISSVIALRGREARDIMVPWEEVFSVRLDRPVAEVVAEMADAPHSRYPVVRESGGPVIGILHARDVWRADRAGEVDLEALLRPPVIVPPTAEVDGLLRELRRARQHMAVVVTEYGIAAGIATMEDALEEIVGEIEDEFDAPDDRIRELDEDRYLVEAASSISDFNRRTGASLDADRAHTVGGLLFAALGRVPEVGDDVEVPGARLEAREVEDHRVRDVLVELQR